MQRLITLGLALYSFFLIRTNIPRLPARIPTHFNAAGEANGWGSPDTLWMLLGVQVLVCGVMLVAPLVGMRYPGTVNLGTRRLSDFAPDVRERLMPIFTNMMGWMGVLSGFLFCTLLTEIIRVSSSPCPHFAPTRELGVFVAGMVALSIYYMRRMLAAANEAASRR
jgi:uncharacterized membrane protein